LATTLDADAHQANPAAEFLQGFRIALPHGNGLAAIVKRSDGVRRAATIVWYTRQCSGLHQDPYEESALPLSYGCARGLIDPEIISEP
jgi:hypothetical protein